MAGAERTYFLLQCRGFLEPTRSAVTESINGLEQERLLANQQAEQQHEQNRDRQKSCGVARARKKDPSRDAACKTQERRGEPLDP